METSSEQLVKGMKLNTYVGLMNLLFLVPSLGWIISLVMWLIGKDESEHVDARGKDMANWFISMIIYGVGCGLVCILLIFIAPIAGLALLYLVGIAIAIIAFVCPIVGGVKALNGEAWSYPLTLQLIK